MDAGAPDAHGGLYLGAWIVLLVVVIYGPVLFGALADPSIDVKVEGLNYFADPLLFGGVILSPARTSEAIPPPSAESNRIDRGSSSALGEFGAN
jgi:hypothetical protein